MKHLLHLTTAFLALSTYSYSETELDIYSGFAKVSDGDTLRIDKTTFRLHGIDAPERFQTCHDEDNQEYNCGIVATTVLRKWTFEKDVTCTSTQKNRDRYNRIVGICYLDEVDLKGVTAELTAGSTSTFQESSISKAWSLKSKAAQPSA